MSSMITADTIRKILSDNINKEYSFSREEAIAIMNLPEEDMPFLMEMAGSLRKKYKGNHVSIHLLTNARSGNCSQNCAYCAQSCRSKADIEKYKWVKIALIGGLSKSQYDMAGAWAATTDRNKVVTLYDALVRKGLEVSYAEGYDMKSNQLTGLQEALQAAEASDVIVVAVGERFGQSGEKASKVNIAIPEGQQKLVSELAKTGKPVIALVMCGRPVIFNEIREHADAVLCTWWLGSEAGNAICNVLWGEYNPSAKLPMTFPAHVGQIPIYYQNKSTGRPTALKQTYKASYIDASTEPAYPFGYGLSYTDFGYSDLKLLPGKAAGVHTEVSVKVTNTGKCAGEEVVQLYVQDKVASVTRPIKELKGFRKIHLNVGESKTVAFQITDDALGFYDNEMNYMVEPGDFVFMVGGSSDDVQQITYNLKE